MKIISPSFLISINLFGTLLVLSSTSWFSIWMGMELTTMTIPPLMVYFNPSLVSKINSWKYFMIQCYASSMFILSVLCLSLSSPSWMWSNILWFTMIFSMLLKMGIFPFHGWLLQISSSTSWPIFLIISSIQKVGPLVVISESFQNLNSFLNSDLILSCLISIISVINIPICSIRYFFVISSVINSAWMIASSQLSKFSFLSFILFYFFHLFILFILISKNFSLTLDAMFFSIKKNFLQELMKILTIMSLIGMPPLVGFFAKVLIIEQLTFSNQFFSALILTLSSSIIMMMYLKMIISSMNNMRMEISQFNLNLPIFLSLILIFSGPLIFLS